MYSLLVLAVISFLVCVAITPAVRRLAFRFGAVDQPDLSRKVHRQPTARIGGVSIMISYLAALGSLLLLPLRGSAALQYQPPIYELLPGVMIIFGVGLADDIFGLKPWHKLLAEAIAASYAYFAGVHVLGFSTHLVGGWLSFILTLGWLLLCTNAFNLIDGIDGLAAGAALVATLTMLIAAKFGDNYGLALATAPLVGSLCGILVYNFNPASIFLGDCGSLTLGYLLGCCGLIWSQKPATLLGMTAPVVVLGLPLLDTTLTIVRRFVGRRPLFIADRSHIHHRLLERGLTPRRVTVLLYGACAVAAALSLTANALQGRYPGLVIVGFCGAAWWGISRLKYIELEVARKVLFQRLRRILAAEMSVVTFEHAMSSASSLDECWKQILRVSEDLGFAIVQMRLGGTMYEGTLKPIDVCACWTLEIPLSDSNDWIKFMRPVRSEFQPATVLPFLDLTRTSLKAALDRFQETPRRRALEEYVGAGGD